MKSIFKNLMRVLVGLIFCCIILTPLSTFSQSPQMTPYQKKVLQINAKYLVKFIYDKPIERLNGEELYEMELLLTSDAEAIESLIQLFFFNYAMSHSPAASESLLNQYENEMKAAVKLKNNVDLQREKELVEKEAKKKRKEEMKNTDMGRIYELIRNRFDQWDDKGEFEKETLWLKRLQDQSEQMFIQMCNTEISNKILEIKPGFKLSDYDSEKEEYKITIYSSISSKIKIPIKEAPAFKEKYEDVVLLGPICFGQLCIIVPQDPSNHYCIMNEFFPENVFLYEFEIEDFFYYDHYDRISRYDYKLRTEGDNLRYSEVDTFKLNHLEGRKHYIIPICTREKINPKYEIEDIIVYFDDLEIDNPFLKGSFYNYTRQTFTPGPVMKKIKEEQEERKRQDSLFHQSKQQLLEAVADYNRQLAMYPYDYQKNAISDSLSFELYGQPEILQDTLKTKLQVISTKKKQLLLQYQADSIAFSLYKDSLQNAITQINGILLQYPYNLSKLTLSDSLSLENFGNNQSLKDELYLKRKLLLERKMQLENEIYNSLKINNFPIFANIYFSLNPNEKTLADSLYIECRCNFKDQLSFNMAFIDKTLPPCECRSENFSQFGHLFKSKEEFDIYFNQEESEFKKEIEYRTELKRDIKKFENELVNENKINLKKASSSEKPEIIEIVERIAYHKNKCYYDEVITLIFNNNDRLTKEWEKNGKFFKNQAEMYEVYIGNDYNDVLKSKKKE